MADWEFRKKKKWKRNWPIKIHEKCASAANKNENSVNKNSDAIWNIYGLYINKWHRIRQTISNEHVYVRKLYT